MPPPAWALMIRYRERTYSFASRKMVAETDDEVNRLFHRKMELLRDPLTVSAWICPYATRWIDDERDRLV